MSSTWPLFSSGNSNSIFKQLLVSGISILYIRSFLNCDFIAEYLQLQKQFDTCLVAAPMGGVFLCRGTRLTVLSDDPTNLRRHARQNAQEAISSQAHRPLQLYLCMYCFAPATHYCSEFRRTELPELYNFNRTPQVTQLKMPMAYLKNISSKLLTGLLHFMSKASMAFSQTMGLGKVGGLDFGPYQSIACLPGRNP